MPIPKPTPKEDRNDFISRCMGDPTMNKEFPKQEQRAAICYSQYRKAKKQKEIKGSNEEPLWEEQIIKNAIIII